MIVGLGTDIIDVHRIRELWEDHPDGLKRRVFTDLEFQYCSSKAHPEEHLAARFAVKEAALKAFGTGWAKGLGFSDIEVVNNEDGKPSLILHGEAKATAQKMNVTDIHVSYSHTPQSATATVILESVSTA